jgi:hypothetical protein
MFKRALAAQLPVPDALGHIGRELGGVGADYSKAQDGALMLEPDMISESIFAATVDMQGEPGHTVRFNRPTFATTTYTEASRLITPTTSISTTPITIGSEQTSFTLKRFAGPYDQTYGRVAPYSLDGLDTQMGVHKASKIVGTHLQYDFDKFLESMIITLLDSMTAIYPTGFTAVNDFTTAGAAPFSYELASYAERVADDANLPVLPDGYRMLVVPPAAAEALKFDSQFARLSEFHKEVNALFPGTYFRSIGKIHLFKSTTLTSTANTSSIPVYRAHFLAPGLLGAGMGKPPKTAYSNDDNYGETAKVIWIAYLTAALLDSSFGRVICFTDTR